MQLYMIFVFHWCYFNLNPDRHGHQWMIEKTVLRPVLHFPVSSMDLSPKNLNKSGSVKADLSSMKMVLCNSELGFVSFQRNCSYGYRNT